MSWVIVTGANGGIGAATVHELIKNGYSVFAADLAEQAALHPSPYLRGRDLPLPLRQT